MGAVVVYLSDENEKLLSVVYRTGQSGSQAVKNGVALIDRATGKVVYRGEVEASGNAAKQQEALQKLQIHQGINLAS